MLLERRVEVVHVRRVMLAVMNLHRLRIDVRLERSEVVRKRGQLAGPSWRSSYVTSPSSASIRSNATLGVLRRLGHGDPVVDLAVEEPFEDPHGYSARRGHRPAEAPERFQRQDGLRRRHVPGQMPTRLDSSAPMPVPISFRVRLDGTDDAFVDRSRRRPARRRTRDRVNH